jgi:hypothetical protein
MNGKCRILLLEKMLTQVNNNKQMINSISES